jgi:hypothetical protein
MNSSSGWLARKPAGIVFNEHTDEDGATVFWQRTSKRLREATEGAIRPLISDACRSTPLFLRCNRPDRHGHRYTIGGLRRLMSCRGNVDLARRDDELPARVLTTIKTRRRS